MEWFDEREMFEDEEFPGFAIWESGMISRWVVSGTCAERIKRYFGKFNLQPSNGYSEWKNKNIDVFIK